ncbi:hypothetical protein ACFYPK_18265 [Streptomyces halstedii]|uniref:hypothetical protein n=1 Tax=Streptomyces TaxID=1883 RepID=UPI0004A8F122|nr:hypothetical protein [Streptomyces sp. NTK 937]KDQ70505.1 membrane protein [Streptomyces sp. NTK 937]WSX35077.1 hypothetical protein OG291_05025 [Streptomyces halstedii]
MGLSPASPAPVPPTAPSSRSPRTALGALRLWEPRQWTAAAAFAVATAVVVGVPTAVVPTPFFGREVPVQWWNYPALALTALLSGLVLATYLRPGPPAASGGRLGSLGGVLSFFAVGCPVCNKIVLLLLGTGGALTYWAPLQPLLALASLALLAEAALRRLNGQVVCPAPRA